MTPKEQAIKKAYGEYYDTFKDEIDEDGWVVYDTKHKHHPEWHGNEEFLDWYCPDFDYDKFRPQSLRGIENNRGWISVKDRLPEEKHLLCWVHDSENRYHLTEWIDGDWWIKRIEPGIRITHWQPIVEPEPPIY